MENFNLPDLNWNDYSHPNTEIYNLFTNFIDEMGLHQFVEPPTRQSNILDLLLSNDACFLSQIKMMPPIAQSDHNTIVFKPNLPSQSIMLHFLNYQHITKSCYRNLNNYFCEIRWSDLFQYCFSIDDCWKLFPNIVANATQNVAPGQGQLIKTTKVKKPSYPKFIIKAQKLNLHAFHKWHKCHPPVGGLKTKISIENFLVISKGS